MENLEETFKESVYSQVDKWCDCEDQNGFDTTFYDDDTHEEVKKHHWRCNKCNKITQIG